MTEEKQQKDNAKNEKIMSFTMATNERRKIDAVGHECHGTFQEHMFSLSQITILI